MGLLKILLPIGLAYWLLPSSFLWLSLAFIVSIFIGFILYSIISGLFGYDNLLIVLIPTYYPFTYLFTGDIQLGGFTNFLVSIFKVVVDFLVTYGIWGFVIIFFIFIFLVIFGAKIENIFYK